MDVRERLDENESQASTLHSEKLYGVLPSALVLAFHSSVHLFAVNIKEYHWLVHQPITPLPRYYTDCPITE